MTFTEDHKKVWGFLHNRAMSLGYDNFVYDLEGSKYVHEQELSEGYHLVFSEQASGLTTTPDDSNFTNSISLAGALMKEKLYRDEILFSIANRLTFVLLVSKMDFDEFLDEYWKPECEDTHYFDYVTCIDDEVTLHCGFRFNEVDSDTESTYFYRFDFSRVPVQSLADLLPSLDRALHHTKFRGLV